MRSHHSLPHIYSRSRQQRGAALMVMLVILIVGASAMLLSSLSSTAARNERDQITADVLAQAKEALIGRAASDNSTPGQLPCPEDTTKIGTSFEGQALGSCSLPAIGRLPWRTLGLGDLRDGNGDKLWYVLSAGFHGTTINSDSQAQLTVNGIPNSAVAIIFSAGPPINGQSRPTPTAATPPVVTQYLELSNNDGDNTFISNGPADTFNDKLQLLTPRDLFRVVEKRIAKEVKIALANYFIANGVYPYPAKFSDASCAGTCTSDPTVCRGRLPQTALPVDWVGMPTWFFTNRWYLSIIYSAGTSRLATSPAGCNPSLLVSGANTPALFFMPGTPLGSYTRPNYTNLSSYLEDAENNNGDDSYVPPGITSNDSLYTLP